jgi:hypothetical protein
MSTAPDEAEVQVTTEPDYRYFVLLRRSPAGWSAVSGHN